MFDAKSWARTSLDPYHGSDGLCPNNPDFESVSGFGASHRCITVDFSCEKPVASAKTAHRTSCFGYRILDYLCKVLRSRTSVTPKLPSRPNSLAGGSVSLGSDRNRHFCLSFHVDLGVDNGGCPLVSLKHLHRSSTFQSIA